MPKWIPNVLVVSRNGRKFFYFKWIDQNGVSKFRSSKLTRRRDAERAAVEFAQELADEAATSAVADDRDWIEFRIRYEDEKLSALSRKNLDQFRTASNRFDEIVKPKSIDQIDSKVIAKFIGKLRKEGKPDSTVAAYLRQIRAALNWAVKVGLIDRVPHIDMPKPAIDEDVKGRPLSEAEIRKMIKTIPRVVGEPAKESWKHFLTGLHLCGLRISESLALSWDNEATYHIRNLDTNAPFLRIPPLIDKSKRGTSIALTPDFVEFLRETPRKDRSGRVFLPQNRKGGYHYRADTVSGLISDIGNKAHIIVDDTKTPPKFASAHDLRRTFAERWKTLPHVTLKTIMRHKDLRTTLKYYAGQNVVADMQVIKAEYQRKLNNAEQTNTEEPTHHQL